MDATIAGVTALAGRLDDAGLAYDLRVVRADGVMFVVAVPGARWEIELMADGSVEVEIFRSDGEILGESALASLLAENDGG